MYKPRLIQFGYKSEYVLLQNRFQPLVKLYDQICSTKGTKR